MIPGARSPPRGAYNEKTSHDDPFKRTRPNDALGSDIFHKLVTRDRARFPFNYRKNIKGGEYQYCPPETWSDWE